MVDRNTSIGIIFGMGIIIALAVGLSQFPVQSEDTIILVNKQGTDPVNSCAPGNGLILAQNLTDLCDVVIVSPSTGQLLRYNGTTWVNVNTSVVFNDTTTCNNIGLGSAFACVEGTNVNLRSLLAGAGISVSNNTNTITITNTLPENTVCTNQLSGEGLCIDDSIELKNMLAGSSISLSSNGTHITIANTSPDNTVCANVGSGTMIYKDGECNFKTLVGSADISITNTTNTIVIDYNGTNNVSSISSDNNNTIGVVPTTGNVVLYPKYELLCQTTLTSSNSTISCNNFSGKNHLFIELESLPTGGTIAPSLRFNGDSGTNYARRTSSNGGADATSTGSTLIAFRASPTSLNLYSFAHIMNFPNIIKILDGSGDDIGSSDSGTAPNRTEIVGKWVNTSVRITSLTVVSNGGTGSFNTGSELTVWGYN